MRPEELQRLLVQHPFNPFRVYVSDGAIYDVTHPEIASILRGNLWVYLPPGGMLDSPMDRVAIVSFLHITRVEIYTPAGTSPSPQGG